MRGSNLDFGLDVKFTKFTKEKASIVRSGTNGRCKPIYTPNYTPNYIPNHTPNYKILYNSYLFSFSAARRSADRRTGRTGARSALTDMRPKPT